MGALIHSQQCRDYSQGNFLSAGPQGGSAVFIHEAGHGLFLLEDEYDDLATGCTTYYETCPGKYCNIFRDQASCQANSINPGGCRQFTTCQGGWWKSQPAGTIMEATSATNWGPDAARQGWDIVNQYQASQSGDLDPWADDSRKAIVVHLDYDGQTVQVRDSTMVYGDTPERFMLTGHLRLELTDARGGVLHSFYLSDPRYRDYYPTGGELAAQAEFGVALPFCNHLRAVRIYKTEGNQLVATVDLAPAIEAFCTEHPEDTQCQTWGRERWTFLPFVSQ
jgi:hypothetical protein